MAVTVTESASRKIREYLTAGGFDGRSVRLAVGRTHCMGGRGHAYHLGPEPQAGEGDVTFESNDLSLFVDPKSAALLGDVEIDFVEGFEGSGFDVRNSKSVGKCPCGHHDLFE